MRDGYVVLETYTSETAARCDLVRLEAAGIPVELDPDNCGGMRPHMDLTLGVRLLVPADALPAARDLLAAPNDAVADGPWTCAACGAAGEPGFDACWQCGRPRG